MFEVSVLIPTARFAFAVRDDVVDVLPEHRSPQAYVEYERLKRSAPVVGMTTFPNTVLLRGERTILVDPGIHLQNQPVVAALARHGLTPSDLHLIVLTHAHLDHAGACVDVTGRVVVHALELVDPDRPMVSGILPRERLQLLEGDSGEIVDGLDWVRTPGHTEGSICLRVATADGLVVVAGDTIGPLREPFDAMTAPDDPDGARLLDAWRTIRSWDPQRIIPGHLPPFELG